MCRCHISRRLITEGLKSDVHNASSTISLVHAMYLCLLPMVMMAPGRPGWFAGRAGRRGGRKGVWEQHRPFAAKWQNREEKALLWERQKIE